MSFSPEAYTPRIQYWLIYVLSILFALHNVLVLYVNSTFIEQFVSRETIGTFYVIGSAIAVLIFLFIARILHRAGNVRLTIWLAIGEIIMLTLLGTSTNPALVISAFVLFLVINPLIYLNLDIFSESLIGDEEHNTGLKRGIALTFMSIAAVLGPLAIGPLVGDGAADLRNVYFVSAAVFSIFVLVVLTQFRTFKDPQYSDIKIIDALASFWRTRAIRLALLAQLTLQIAFAWLVIYVPLYMATEIGLTWDEIGTILAFGLFAYVLLEFPVGFIADRHIGEKEMMALGFVVLSLSVASISFVTDTDPLPWIIIMFMTRVGASLVEATIESYFFKHTKGTDTNYLSFFRLTRPLAFVIGGLLGSACLLFLPFSLIFIVLAVVLLGGVLFASLLQDTR